MQPNYVGPAICDGRAYDRVVIICWEKFVVVARMCNIAM